MFHKKFLKIMLFFLIPICSISIAKEVNKAIDMGKYTFGVIKRLNEETSEEYLKHFITPEDYRTLAENEKIDISLRNQMSSSTKDYLNNFLYKSYHQVKKSGKKVNINWNKIKYKDYTYLIENHKGLDSYVGTLYITYKDKEYKIEVSSLLIDNSFKLVNISFFGN